MNKNNLDTWPKTIYLVPRNTQKSVMHEIPAYDHHHDCSEWLDKPIKVENVASVGYMRLDEVLKLEAKLKAENNEAKRWSLSKILMSVFGKGDVT